MRKLFTILFVFLAVSFSCMPIPSDIGIEYSGMIPRVVVWDQDLTVDEDGNLLIDGDVITYRVYCTKAPFGENEVISLVDVDEMEATIDISGYSRGWYYVGVSSIGTNGEGVSLETEIAWSNASVNTNPTQRFAFRVTGPFVPALPTALHVLN